MSLKVDMTDGLDFSDERVTVCLIPLFASFVYKEKFVELSKKATAGFNAV